MLSEADFPSILDAARLGQEWAWSLLYRDLAPAILRYLKAHGAREAEDLLGEVFVQVVRDLPSFCGDDRDFRAWVFMVAHNRLVDEWRRNGRDRADLLAGDALYALSPAGDAEDDAMRRLAEERVRRVLERLSPDQRDVLFLRFFARLKIEEVATVLAKRPGAVKSLQARGLAAIRRAISKEAVSL